MPAISPLKEKTLLSKADFYEKTMQCRSYCHIDWPGTAL